MDESDRIVIYDYVIAILKKGLTRDQWVAFSLTLDKDPHDGFLEYVDEYVETIAPELFG